MNGIYLYFVNKHLSRWALLGLQINDNEKMINTKTKASFSFSSINNFWKKKKILGGEEGKVLNAYYCKLYSFL